MRLSLLLLSCLAFACAGFAQSPKLEIAEGDRVLLLGDALLEHEDEYGSLETRMVEQFHDRHFTVRNLSWSGDTPLGVSRASFDRPSKGWERLQEQIADVKPTVAILGFGMAASLQEVADRSGDITLNPDTTRYGIEPMNVKRFKAEYNKLLDELEKTGVTRFVLLSPIRHEDLRGQRPGLPDPSAHEKLLTEYMNAIRELAGERKATFVSLRLSEEQKTPPLTLNGIHPTKEGYERLWRGVAEQLGWAARTDGLPQARHAALNEAIVRKNQLFFHRWRPENYTYLFGFRKREQGQNAKEIPEFDPLIAQLETEIDRIKNEPVAITQVPKVEPAAPIIPPATTALPPTFDVQDGFQIDLWATNPLLEKPVQMNWDDTGRLWIASSSTYPQVNPEDVAASLAKDIAGPKGGPSAGNDRIIIVESSKPGGPPDKSTVFAEGLLIPTAVAPFRDAKGHWGCYVGQSTELLELIDTDGDGKADQRRVILSGFGTEDTHHLIHTLKWGPDGNLYFDQSIYIHSHLETPWGMVRVNSGAVMSWDPRTEKVAVHYKGFCNPWGHVWDKQGLEFVTDGAGFQGLTWCIPGAMYFTYENGRKIAPSISPGTYPKFASLEIIQSPAFPADWQGSFITCDFRAHRIVHFGINDLTQQDPPKSGFITQELPDLVRTTDVSFRPIDVRLGPDGALYVADWSNPVINHGEVDFRDPRRDHTSGRIWKISRKDLPLLPWGERKPGPVVHEIPKSPAETRIADANPRTRLLAMRDLARTQTVESAGLVLQAALRAPAEDPYYDYASWLSINDLAAPWTNALLAGTWKIDSAEREKQFEFALKSLDPAYAEPVLAKVLEGREIPSDGSGPWIEMIGSAGGSTDLGRLLTMLVSGQLNPPASERAAVALGEAMRLRKLKPAGDLASIEPLLKDARGPVAAHVARLLGLWQTPRARQLLTEVAKGDPVATLRLAAIDGLRELGGAPAVGTLRELSALRPAEGVARGAAVALATLDLRGSAAQIVAVLNDLTDDRERTDAWRAIISAKGAPDQVADLVTKSPSTFALTKPAAAAGLHAARELGKNGQKLVTALSPAGTPTAPPAADYASTAALVLRDGDPARGEEIYRRAALLCTSCHAIGGAGGKVGPELTSLGASAPLDYIIESVVAPAAKVKEGYFAVSVTLKDGTAVVGIPVRETAQELFLRNAVGQDIAVVKASIASKEVIGSIMPAGLDLQLQPREKIDLYAFLSRLGKPGGYDASKGNVARYWALNPGALWDKERPEQPTAETPAYTLVDGRLTRELLTNALQLLPNAGESVIAVARFQVPAAGTINLNLVGASEVRLDGKPVSFAAAKPLPITLAAGEHTLGVRLQTRALPEVLRLESPEVRFLGN